MDSNAGQQAPATEQHASATGQQAPAISVRQVRRVYGDGVQAITALDEINLQIPAGRFVAIKGRSGSGKTTLLNCIGGLDQPTGGTVYVHEQPVHLLDDEAATAWRQKEVGFVFQSFGLLPTLSAYENVELMLRIAGYPRRQRRQRALECLRLVGLERWMHHRPYELSGGQQQRIAIARAIANQPKVILADEATGELDSETAREILSLLQRIARDEGVTVLLASHDSLVDQYVDEVLHLVDGRIQYQNGQAVVTHPPLAGALPQGDQTPPGEQAAPGVEQQDDQTWAKPLAPTLMDVMAAMLVGIGTLLLYLRTLAPDILYADSAEFQTLAYTLGIAHPTGYPVYLILARLFGFLPIGTLAWRINLLSAVAAAGTVAGIYLLCCYVSRRRAAALLSCAALVLSYTFWAQAVIAEVYTMGTLWWVLTMLALWHWGRQPEERTHWLFVAALLSGLSPGMHLYNVLIAPAALLYVFWVVRGRPGWQKQVAVGAAGTVAGLVLFLLAFLFIDARQSPSGYDYVAQYTSGVAWGVTAEDMDTPLKRLYQSLSAPQWQVAMFPGGIGFMLSRLAGYFLRLLAFEFGLIIFIAAILGLRRLWRENRHLAGFMLVAFLTTLILVVNYEPGDKHIFYLPTYLLLVVGASAGLDRILGRVAGEPTASPIRRYAIPLLLLLLVGQHFWGDRIEALAAGKATFVSETYPYPVDDLEEPRRLAEVIAASLPDDAFLMMDWQPLYAVYYVAVVEQGKTGITLAEPTPYGTEGRVMPPLVEQIRTALEAGRPVYSDDGYGLDRYFTLRREANGLFRLSLP